MDHDEDDVRDRIEENQRLLGEFQFCGDPTVFLRGRKRRRRKRKRRWWRWRRSRTEEGVVEKSNQKDHGMNG